MPEILFFPYYGPNRRSDRRVVEIRLDFGSDESSGFPLKVSDIRTILVDSGVLTEGESFPEKPPPDDRTDWYSSLLAQTALLLQRKNDHRVKYFCVSCEPGIKRCTALVEHEHSEVGMAAVKLAISMFSGRQESLAEDFRSFSKFARERVLPLETEAIINAARRRKIPVFQLDREPLSGLFDTGFRIRRNGLLSLGHGVTSHVLDGTFCVDKAGDYLKALLRNPDQRMALLRQFEIPTVQLVDRNNADTRKFILLIINGNVTAVEQLANGNIQVIGGVHESLLHMCRAISEEAGFAPVAVTVLTTDISRSLTRTGGWVQDFNLAPNLNMLLRPGNEEPDLLDSAADSLLNWLFPDHQKASMPIVAITGTNGKTTTSRMISHILQMSGRKPGLVCTDGIFLNGRQVSHADASSFIGHARVLTSNQVDLAVLETHHRGIAVRGFAFQSCDIAVCLNVTAEHLEEGEIETVEEMAVIKRALLERASKVAVLFADDAYCMAMLKFLQADTICLVSLQSTVAQLRRLVSHNHTSFCVLETMADEQWIILYSDQQRLPVMPVVQIPATFDGTARFNISNAMHAIVACHFAGTNIRAIRSSLSAFSAGQEMTPGRMNVYDELPFRIIIDFAHNADGMIKVCDFIDRQTVTGRKLIAFAGSGKRNDETNIKAAQAVAGHFDFYFCKDYEPSEPPKRKYMASFMQQVLIEEGIAENQTAILTFGKNQIFKIFDACEPGDLLLMLLGHVEKKTVPGYIRDYARR